MDGPIDQCNHELRAIMRKIWKRTPEKILDSVVPPPGDGKIINLTQTFLIPISLKPIFQTLSTAI